MPPFLGITYSSYFLSSTFVSVLFFCLGLRSCVPLLLLPAFLDIIFEQLKTNALIYNQFEVMLNPLRHLGGKLNHLHIPQTRYLRIIELANAIRPSSQSNSYQEATADSILALRSSTERVDPRTYHKFKFDLQVHTEAAVYALPSTIFDDLNPHERKISHLISTYAAKLNSRQLLYLNLAFRKRLGGEFPDWQTLHLSEESPSKVDLEVLPTLSATSRIPELKALLKKTVMKEVISAKSAA